jgi:flagellar assembly protein FliH
MNLNRSCIVITPKETIRREEKVLEKVLSVEDEEQLPPAVREMATQYIKTANEKAQQIVYNARVEAEQIKVAAHTEGYEQGTAQGRQQIAAELRAKNEEVAEVLSRIEAYRQNLYQMLESDILSLSMDVAEKIINTQIDKDDNVFRDIIKKAVASIRHADDFSLYVSKDDHDRYFKDGGQWLRDDTHGASIEINADGNLPKGSCIIEADSEIVDAGVPMQIGKISQFLSERVE